MANFGILGNAANDFINGTPSQGIIIDTITGKDKGNGAVYQAIDDYVQTPSKNFNMEKFANALSGVGNTLGSMNLGNSQQYQYRPSNVDYSQFMRGLTPRTQSFYNRGM